MSANDYERVGHVQIFEPNLNLRLFLSNVLAAQCVRKMAANEISHEHGIVLSLAGGRLYANLSSERSVVMPLVGLSGSIVFKAKGGEVFPRALAASLSGGFNLEL
jgi:hypothetical protein